MPAITSTWLIGSIEQIVQQDITANGNAVSLSAGPYYLRHATAGRSLVDAFEAMLVSAGVASANVYIGQDRLVHIEASATFSIVWGTGTTLRDLLGFSGTVNVADGVLETADFISPLLFSAGWPGTMATIEGVEGYDVEDEISEKSVDGTVQDSDYHNVQIWQEIEWEAVYHTRVRVPASSNGGGTWHEFRRQVLRPNYLFDVYESMTENSASTSAASFGAALGPYRRRTLPAGNYERNSRLRNANTLWDLGIEMIVQSDYA